MSAIKAGDLAMIVHCCGCAGSQIHMGLIVEVESVFVAPQTAGCTYCWLNHLVDAGVKLGGAWEGVYPRAWLRRIDPLTEPERVEHREGIAA